MEGIEAVVAPPDRESLILSAHKLVFKIARDLKYLDTPYDDLVQEGCVGLCIAADKYDLSYGVRFSTYATYWIKACMRLYALRNKGPVRFFTTKWQFYIYSNISRVRRKFERNGEHATVEQLAQALGVTTDEMSTALARLQDTDFSLDAVYGEQSMPYQMRDGSQSVDEALDDVRGAFARSKRVREAVKTLDKKLAEVVQLRYLQQEPLTLREIGERWGVSRERVRQVEVQALLVLKKKLADLQEDQDED